FRYKLPEATLGKDQHFADRRTTNNASIDRAGRRTLLWAAQEDLFHTLQRCSRAQRLPAQTACDDFADLQLACQIACIPDGAPGDSQTRQPLSPPLTRQGLKVSVGRHIVCLAWISDGGGCRGIENEKVQFQIASCLMEVPGALDLRAQHPIEALGCQ